MFFMETLDPNKLTSVTNIIATIPSQSPKNTGSSHYPTTLLLPPLKLVKQSLDNIMIANNRAQVIWSGETARFIVNNLKL